METVMNGRLLGVADRTDTVGVKVWFAYEPLTGEAETLETLTDEAGEFTFQIPQTPVVQAKVGAVLLGVTPVDLEADGSVLEGGELVLMVDDILPSHMKFGGA